MGKRPKRSVADQEQLAAIGARIQHVINLKFGSGQRPLAEATGISQPTWSRVIAGRQAPSWKVLVALMELGVNTEWVLTDRGQPFFQESPEHRAGQPHFLVAKAILPGQPQQHRMHLLHLDLHLDELTRSASRYWLQIQPRDPIADAPDEDIRGGDLVLLETDPDYWMVNLCRLKDEIGAFRVRVGEANLLLLGRIRAEFQDADEPCKLTANIFGVGQRPVSLPENYKRTYGKELRPIDLSKNEPSSSVSRPEGKKDRSNECGFAELLAVKIYVWRP